MMVIAFQSSPILSLPRARSRVLAAVVVMVATYYLKLASAVGPLGKPKKRNRKVDLPLLAATLCYVRPSGCPSWSLRNFRVIENRKGSGRSRTDNPPG